MRHAQFGVGTVISVEPLDDEPLQEGFVAEEDVNGLNVVRVCAQADVPPGTVRAFAVGSNTLAVYNIDGAYYVTDDECTHAAASLADGMLDGDVIECCMHMGSFHVPTGKAVQAPCFTDLKTFRTEVKDGQVLVDLNHPADGAGG